MFGVAIILAGWLRLSETTQREMLREYLRAGFATHDASITRIGTLLPPDAQPHFAQLCLALRRWVNVL